MLSDMLEQVNVSFTIYTFEKYFRKNGYPQNFIATCFKLFLDMIHFLKEKVPKVEKMSL